jgi:thioredoxin 1
MIRATRCPAAASAAALVVLLLAGCGGGAGSTTGSDLGDPVSASPAPDESTTSGARTPKPTATASVIPGSYIGYADYRRDAATFDREGDVVLFFHAGWCPTCQAAEANLTSQPVPDGLTIVKTDFDTMTELRQRYGVTVQHTFVQIDADGEQLAKWSGSTTAEEIADQVQ